MARYLTNGLNEKQYAQEKLSACQADNKSATDIGPLKQQLKQTILKRIDETNLFGEATT
jgi:hypothetical protein